MTAFGKLRRHKDFEFFVAFSDRYSVDEIFDLRLRVEFLAHGFA
jgi:hypothetical protein